MSHNLLKWDYAHPIYGAQHTDPADVMTLTTKVGSLIILSVVYAGTSATSVTVSDTAGNTFQNTPPTTLVAGDQTWFSENWPGTLHQTVFYAIANADGETTLTVVLGEVRPAFSVHTSSLDVAAGMQLVQTTYNEWHDSHPFFNDISNLQKGDFIVHIPCTWDPSYMGARIVIPEVPHFKRRDLFETHPEYGWRESIFVYEVPSDTPLLRLRTLGINGGNGEGEYFQTDANSYGARTLVFRPTSQPVVGGNILWVDLENGSDDNTGLYPDVPIRTVHKMNQLLRGWYFEEVRFAKTQFFTSNQYTWVDNSGIVNRTDDGKIVTIDNCDTGWTAAANITRTHTNASANLREGAASLQITPAAAFVTGKVAFKALPSVDISGCTTISFLIKSASVIPSGRWELRLCSDSVGDVSEVVVPVPAINTTAAFVPVVLENMTLGIYNSVAIYAVADPGTTIVYFDNIIATTHDEMNHTRVICAYEGSDPRNGDFYGVNSITPTQIRLNDGYKNNDSGDFMSRYFSFDRSVSTAIFDTKSLTVPFVLQDFVTPYSFSRKRTLFDNLLVGGYDFSQPNSQPPGITSFNGWFPAPGNLSTIDSLYPGSGMDVQVLNDVTNPVLTFELTGPTVIRNMLFSYEGRSFNSVASVLRDGETSSGVVITASRILFRHKLDSADGSVPFSSIHARCINVAQIYGTFNTTTSFRQNKVEISCDRLIGPGSGNGVISTSIPVSSVTINGATVSGWGNTFVTGTSQVPVVQLNSCKVLTGVLGVNAYTFDYRLNKCKLHIRSGQTPWPPGNPFMNDCERVGSGNIYGVMEKYMGVLNDMSISAPTNYIRPNVIRLDRQGRHRLLSSASFAKLSVASLAANTNYLMKCMVPFAMFDVYWYWRKRPFYFVVDTRLKSGKLSLFALPVVEVDGNRWELERTAATSDPDYMIEVSTEFAVPHSGVFDIGILITNYQGDLVVSDLEIVDASV